MSKVHELMTLMRAEGGRLSRNRNFDLFEEPTARLALRRHLHLRSLERDLLRFGKEGCIRLLIDHAGPPEGDRIVLALEVPAIRLHRRVYLSRPELQLLREVPGLDKVLPALELEGQ